MSKDRKRGPGRPRKAPLVPTKNGISARVWVEEEGVLVRRQVKLGTRSRVVANVKKKRLLEGEHHEKILAQSQTFREEAERIVGQSEISTKGQRLSRLRRYAFPIVGDLLVTEITSVEIKDVLAAVEAEVGGWTGTVRHMKNDISAVLAVLFGDNVIKENAALRIQFKKKGGTLGGRRIQRVIPPRLSLTDDECERFFAAGLEEGEGEFIELDMLCLVARFLGGMRTSDLHAWRWEHIDLEGWADAFVPRPKTDKEEDMSARHELDEDLVPHLIAWWIRRGRPSEGPVFPARRGRKAGTVTLADGTTSKRKATQAGDHKAPGMSYARPLQDALWRRGVVRPLPGFERAKTDAERRKLCALQEGGAKFSRVDFHSFRRSFSTATSRATELTPFQAMALSDHKDLPTYQRYHAHAQVIRTPKSALPRIMAPSVPLLPPAQMKILNDNMRARKDSNLRPSASEDHGQAASQPFPSDLVNSGPPEIHDKTPGDTEQRQNSLPLSNASASTASELVELLELATKARRWTLVTSLGAQLDALAKAAPAPGVASLDAARKKRGGK